MPNSFLKKMGSILNAGSGLISIGSGLIPIFGPLITAIVPKSAPAVQNVSDELPAIARVIVQIESIGQALQLPGAKKVEIAAPLVAQIILASPLAIGKKVKDQALFMRGVTGMSGGMADILNSFDEADAKIIDVTEYKVTT